MFAILLGMQVVQLGIFARAFAAAHLGETDRFVERAYGRLRLEHGLAGGGLLLLAGIVTLLAIFVSWAIGGFGGSPTSTRPRSDSRSSRSACR